MAPYDSESSDDEDAGPQNYTETNVLLGYADPEDQDADDDAPDDNKETVSRLGGRPDWIVDGQAPPSASLARCLVCKALLVLLLQLNGELPERFPGHERRLYVLACRNKACRRKPGSVRAIRGVRVDAAVAEAAAAAEKAKKEKAEATQASKLVGTAPGLGNSLFGVANPFSAGSSGSTSNANPFSLGASSSSSSSATGGASKPFSLGGAASSTSAKAPAAKPEASQKTADEAAKELPKTFAETLNINNDQSEPVAAAPAEPWPPVDSWPAAYPISWIADAEYETLDPTPAVIPGVVTEPMEVEGESSAGGSGGGSGKEDKFVFESDMDAAFQKFADRVAQNPDQVIRYEFNGLPLFYNKDDTVAKIWAQSQAGGSISTVMASTSGRLPPCPNCRARRVFEVQLMPHAIDLLEADDLGLEGMDWGSILVAVCEKDCQAKATAAGEASYLEEWVGVQWEDLAAQRR